MNWKSSSSAHVVLCVYSASEPIESRGRRGSVSFITHVWCQHGRFSTNIKTERRMLIFVSNICVAEDLTSRHLSVDKPLFGSALIRPDYRRVRLPEGRTCRNKSSLVRCCGRSVPGSFPSRSPPPGLTTAGHTWARMQGVP